MITKDQEREKEYTFLEMEAALCVWECLVEMRQGWKHKGEDIIQKAWDDYGTVEMRLNVAVSIGRYAIEFYDMLPSGYVTDELGWSYDWDFIPFVVSLVKDIRYSERSGGLKPVMPSMAEAQQVLIDKVKTRSGQPL